MKRYVNLYIKPDDEKVWSRYQNRPNLVGDAGFDLYVPETVVFAPYESRKVSMGVSCMMTSYYSGFDFFQWMYETYVFIAYVVVRWLSFIFPHLTSKIPKPLQICHETQISYLIYPRSSIANTPLLLANSVGVVDSGYRGPIMAALRNTSSETFTLNAGTRIIQLCEPGLMPLNGVSRVDSFEETKRGSHGFGSTGGTS